MLHNATPGESPTVQPPLRLLAPAAVLDFTNTINGRDEAEPRDHLGDYSDLVEWAVAAAMLTPEGADALRAAAAAAPDAAHAVLVCARTLREAIFALFDAYDQGAVPAADEIGVLNDALRAAQAHLALAPHGDHYDWIWMDGEGQLDSPLWPIARAAAELLTSGALAHVHKCANANCGWLFMDRSKNHSRRWCDMNDCGNRAKVQRYRQRRKAAA